MVNVNLQLEYIHWCARPLDLPELEAIGQIQGHPQASILAMVSNENSVHEDGWERPVIPHVLVHIEFDGDECTQHNLESVHNGCHWGFLAKLLTNSNFLFGTC